MAEIGMLDNGDFQWKQVNSVGRVLRENQFYKAFEMKKEGAGHDLLLAEIQQSLLHGKEKETKMSTTISCRHFFFIESLFLFKSYFFQLYYSSFVENNFVEMNPT